MRGLWLVLIAGVASAGPTTVETAETLVGWSADGERLPNTFAVDPTCSGGGWMITRKSDSKVVHRFSAGNDHCFKAVHGYLDASGKHALVEITESSAKLVGDDLSTTIDTKFALVDL
ncbi:MAG TPA: hypothetical protein VMJ10_35575 [Kofleriaceae bacterium]|nr:hypothetical protein [Kofleriaceae bacterium]